MLRVDRNHPQRLSSGSSLSHEKEWNDLCPQTMLASTFGHYLGCFSFGRAYAIGAKDNRVPDRAGKQPQRTVLPTQQIVGKIQTAQHIKTCTRNAYGRDDMLVHSTIVELHFGDYARMTGINRPPMRHPN